MKRMGISTHTLQKGIRELQPGRDEHHEKGIEGACSINSKTYHIKRPIEDSYQKRLARQVFFAPELGQWNYLVKPVN